MSLKALTACDLVEGRTVYYTKPEEQQDLYGTDPCNPNPCEVDEVCYIRVVEGGENTAVCRIVSTDAPTEPPDVNYEPSRTDPNVFQQETFTLGVYKTRDVSDRNYFGGCLDYSNEITDQWLDDGAAEGSARFFGTLAATFGGMAIFGFLALAGADTKNKLYSYALGGVLVAAAVSQMFIFTLFASAHCDNEFWEGYRSVEDLTERTAVTTSCEMGDGGWYAIIALLLYIFAALLALTKWFDPRYQLCTMEWTKDYSRDGGRYETNRTWVPHGGDAPREGAAAAVVTNKPGPPQPYVVPAPLHPLPEQQHVLNVVRPAAEMTEEYEEEDERTPFTGPGPDQDGASV